MNWFPQGAYQYDFAGQLHAIANDVIPSTKVGTSNGGGANSFLNDDQVAKQLRQMFEPSLQLHENGKYMKVIFSFISDELVRKLQICYCRRVRPSKPSFIRIRCSL